jgi:8-oxo-dGTP pyrophosphatase MutT (NUDIX family)
MKELVSLANKIKLNAEIKLPGIEAHKTMLPEGRNISDDYLNNIKNYKQSAVFALLFQEQKKIHLLLTQRHQYEGKHSGQISFPGGKKEEFDIDLLSTALRETEEEVGINKENINLITQLSPLYIPVSNFFVQPYIGYLKALPKLSINNREVKSLIKLPVDYLNKSDIIISKKIEASSGLHLTVPAYEFEGNIIWGATAMMLSEIAFLIKS